MYPNTDEIIDSKDMNARIKRFSELTCGQGNPYYFNRFKYQSDLNRKRKKTFHLHSECAICLGMMNRHEKSWITSCQHIFHKSCLREWLYKTKYNGSCPICRQDMGCLEFLDGITYVVFPDCDNYIDILEEVKHLLPHFCHYCDNVLGMNKECEKCHLYCQSGQK